MAKSSRFGLSQTLTNDMLKMLDSPQPEIIARGLLLIGQKAMIPLARLDQLYEAGNSEVRIAVLEYLARNLPPGHTTLALKALSDSKDAVRIKAVEYLITSPNVNAAPILETLLKDPVFPRKDLLIRAFESCDDGRAAAVLLPFLREANHPYRMSASGIIGRIDGQPIIHELLFLLASEDEMTSLTASIALAGVRDEQVIEPALKAIEKWWSTTTTRIPYEAAHLLDKFRDPRIRDTLLHLLMTKPSQPTIYSDMTRTSAIHVLGNYPEPRVIAYFVQLLQHGTTGDRYAVTYAFTKMKSAEAVDALMENISYETDPNILVNYSYAFATLGDQRAVPILEEVLKRVDVQSQSSIQTNLRSLNPPPAAPTEASLFTKLKSRFKRTSRPS